MSTSNSTENKKVLILAITSVIASILFSFLGAPFLRALAVSTRSLVFWSTGTVLVATLFLFGIYDQNISQAAVYVGAIWMTLGSYSELEKRGVIWKQAGPASLLAGVLFASLGYFLISKNQTNSQMLNQIVEPLLQGINKAFPENPIEASVLVGYLPGIFIASLFGSLAFGFLLESKVVRLFQIQKFKVASSLKGLEFRLPDLFIWTSLFSLLFSAVNFNIKPLQTVSINILIISAVAYLFQGLVVVEFLMRFLRLGTFSRVFTYGLILFQLAPFVVFVGLIDYWADFRKRVRRKAKSN